MIDCIIAVLAILGVMLAIVILASRDKDDDDPEPETPPPAPKRRTAHNGCPGRCPNPLEHLCHRDPVDAAILDRMADFYAGQDPRWHNRLSRFPGKVK